MMAADERALLAETLGQLACEHDGAELFTAMGRAGSTSAAIPRLAEL